ncbi:MAG: hypothetical protein ACKVVP_10565 [Chloroflexota bacterium]
MQSFELTEVYQIGFEFAGIADKDCDMMITETAISNQERETEIV